MRHLVLILSIFALFAWADTEPNNTCNQANEILVNSIAYGSLKSGWWGSDPDDYYYFTPSQNGTIDIYIQEWLEGGFPFPASLEGSLQNSNCTITHVSGTSKDGSLSLNYEVNAGTTYKIHLHASSGSGNYSLRLDFTQSLPGFSIDDHSFNEGNEGWHIKKIPVILSSPQDKTVTVDYAMSDITATDGEDYNQTSGTLAFNPGDTTRTIPVDVNGDTDLEPDETFKITLFNPTGGTIIEKSTSIITLINDDGESFFNSERDFMIRNPINSRNIKGNIAVIGNTVLCPKNRRGECIESTGDTTNAYLDLKYVNTSNYNGNFKNSSQAKLSIPPNATIKWAGFYAQGYLSKSYSFTSAKTTLNDPVELTIPNNGTISILPTISNLVHYTSNRYTYGSYSEISQLIGKSGSEVNGWVTAANIKAYEGKSGDGLGNFGAWTLVVVYEDKNESLKNISVFDGYRSVNSSIGSVDITVDGFLTPTSGDVNSALSVFAGEGDKHITGDKLFLDNAEISVETNNAFNSSISGVERNPEIINNQGIDIQNHDVSYIIGNRQTSATIRLTSTQDAYYPSMVAFTTELYEPRVCYVQELYDENGNELSNPKVGDIITVDTWISNMKKDAEDGDLETADKVLITVELDDENTTYEKESTKIKNIGDSEYKSQADAKNVNLADFIENDNNSKWRVGTGANSVDGGRLLPNATGADSQKVFVRFKTKLKKTGDISISNVYKVSYENSLLGIRFGDESPLNIGICKDFDTGLSVGGTIGAFNVVNQNFSGSSNSNDFNAKENALYTQIADQPFTVKLLSLDEDFITLKHIDKTVEVSFIETPTYIPNDDTGNQNRCDIAPPLMIYSDIKFESEAQKELTLSYPNAHKSLSFKVTFTDEDDKEQHVCSRDPGGFAVRPATYAVEANATKLIGGAEYKLTITAQDISDSNLTDYTQQGNKIDGNMKLFVPTDCTTLSSWDDNLTINTNFIKGELNYLPFSYDNVGDINVTITDKKWTLTDQDSYSKKGYNDCIIDSNTTTPNSEGKIGCNVSAVKTFSFIPKKFGNRVRFNHPADDNFAYMGANEDFSPQILLTTQALLDKNKGVATNYTADCYAKDIDYTIAFEKDVPIGWKHPDGIGNNATDAIYFFDDDGITTNIVNINDHIMKASSSEGNFTDGVASDLTFAFNFEKPWPDPQNPFKVTRNDFNITSLLDADNVKGKDFNRTNDHNATFYYGRVHAPDYRGASPITAEIGYEVYCKNCNRADFNISNRQSPSSPSWFFNTRHDDLDHGMVNGFASSDGTTMNKLMSLNILNGSEDLTLTAPIVPHMDRITMTPNPWLVFDPHSAGATITDFIVEFVGSGGWAGEGTVDKDKSDIIGEHLKEEGNSERTNRRISW